MHVHVAKGPLRGTTTPSMSYLGPTYSATSAPPDIISPKATSLNNLLNPVPGAGAPVGMPTPMVPSQGGAWASMIAVEKEKLLPPLAAKTEKHDGTGYKRLPSMVSAPTAGPNFRPAPFTMAPSMPYPYGLDMTASRLAAHAPYPQPFSLGPGYLFQAARPFPYPQTYAQPYVRTGNYPPPPHPHAHHLAHHQHHHHSATISAPHSQAVSSSIQDDAKRSPYARSPRLKLLHKMAERKRRSQLRELLEELKCELKGSRNLTMSKSEIVDSALITLEELKEKQRELKKAKESLLA